jgi:ribosomal protein S1
MVLLELQIETLSLISMQIGRCYFIKRIPLQPSIKVGDTVEVLIDIREDKTGQLVLSHRKARTIKSWDRVISANETGEIVNGFVNAELKVV